MSRRPAICTKKGAWRLEDKNTVGEFTVRHNDGDKNATARREKKTQKIVVSRYSREIVLLSKCTQLLLNKTKE